MQSLRRRKLDMAARVRDFCRAHIAAEPGLGPALARLEERLVRAAAIDARRMESFAAVKAGHSRRRELRQMIRANSGDQEKLKAEFEAKLAADTNFSKSPRARLQWFYQRSRYYDDRYLLYPVGVER